MQILVEDIIETNLTATIINFNWRLYQTHRISNDLENENLRKIINWIPRHLYV